MSNLARDVMTSNPAVCTPDMPIEQVARLMVQHNCGEIPVVDRAERPVGVITDRDIVCRLVAQGRNPLAYTAEFCMTDPVVTVRDDATLAEVLSVMERHQIRRVPVVDNEGACVGIVSQADLAWSSRESDVAQLVREVSRDSSEPSR